MLALAACAQGGQVPCAPYSPENMHDRGGDMQHAGATGPRWSAASNPGEGPPRRSPAGFAPASPKEVALLFYIGLVGAVSPLRNSTIDDHDKRELTLIHHNFCVFIVAPPLAFSALSPNCRVSPAGHAVAAYLAEAVKWRECAR